MPSTDRIPYRFTYGPDKALASMPLGGLGTGMVSLSANGTLEHVSIRHKPEMFHEPWLCASLHSRTGGWTRICQGQIPDHRIMKPSGQAFGGAGSGAGHYGLPCYRDYQMRAAFPFCEIDLHDESIPVDCTICGWSPFIPGDDAATSLPMGQIEYEFHNRGSSDQELVFGYHAENFMANGKRGDERRIERLAKGFALTAVPKSGEESCCCGDGGCCDSDSDNTAPEPPVSFAVQIDAAETTVDCAWFRSGWFDIKTARWEHIRAGIAEERPPHSDGDAPGGSAHTCFTLKPGERRRIAVTLSWYQATFNVWDKQNTTWYAEHFDDISSLATHLATQTPSLRERSATFARALHDSDLPVELIEAVARPLAILKSPTVLRLDSGKVWGWEGCHDGNGCCNGSCTHVYNYAQALAFLFPQLERGLRDTEHEDCMRDDGLQDFRAPLPIEADACEFNLPACADGQLGGLIQVYREWRNCGDDAWLKGLWPAMRKSLEYCITTWDPKRIGRLAEPHHNTYDIEFWGEDGLGSVIYAGSLAAMIAMAEHLGEDCADWATINAKVQQVIRNELHDGWIRQNVRWRDLQANDPTAVTLNSQRMDSPECLAAIEEEGPRYQYGSGVLSDAVLGAYCARIAGLGAIIDEEIEDAQLDAIMQHNFKADLLEHACPQRPSYAVADEGGLIMCSWPDGGRPTMPFVYSDEVWTGVEHQVAAHLCLRGRIDDAIAIERAVQRRYDGRRRNPFDEFECGHYYYRALSSYGILMGLSGARYDAIEKVLYIEPRVSGDFRCFFAVGSSWGQVGVRGGEPFIDLAEGELTIERIAYTAYAG